MDYQFCSQQMDCITFRNLSHLKEDCVSGCFCTNDYVFEDGKCVDPAMCPGEFYKFSDNYGGLEGSPTATLKSWCG